MRLGLRLRLRAGVGVGVGAGAGVGVRLRVGVLGSGSQELRSLELTREVAEAIVSTTAIVATASRAIVSTAIVSRRAKYRSPERFPKPAMARKRAWGDQQMQFLGASPKSKVISHLIAG